MAALLRQGEAFPAPAVGFVLGVSRQSLHEALDWAAQKRREGISVSLQYDAGKAQLIQMVAQGRALKAACVADGEVRVWSGEEQAWK